MKYFKKIALLVISIIIIAFIFFLLSLLSSVKKESPTPTTTTPTPIPIPTVDISSGRKLMQILKERPTPVVKTDTQARDALISTLNYQSGTIIETASFNLRYIKSANQFEAQIKSLAINEAKNAVVSYLKKAGLSEDGICKLPLIFFADATVSNELQKTNTPFTPIPDFCK